MCINLATKLETYFAFSSYFLLTFISLKKVVLYTLNLMLCMNEAMRGFLL